MRISPLQHNWCRATVLGLSLMGAAVAQVHAEAWQTVSAERLIQMPVQSIEKVINSELRKSDLGQDMQDSDTRLGDLQHKLGKLSGQLKKGKNLENRQAYLEAKSDYLDELDRQHSLRDQAIAKRRAVLKDVLAELKRDRRRANDPVLRERKQQQSDARARMQRVLDLVDDSLANGYAGAQTRYSTEYNNNMNAIKQYQAAIAAHDLSQGEAEGSQSREQYVRELLSNIESDRALLEQEREMVRYMARLVSLDAQALQFELAYGGDGEGGKLADAAAHPATMTDIFVN